MYGIFTYFWVLCMVNVGKYSMEHLGCGNPRVVSIEELQSWSPESGNTEYPERPSMTLFHVLGLEGHRAMFWQQLKEMIGYV